MDHGKNESNEIILLKQEIIELRKRLDEKDRTILEQLVSVSTFNISDIISLHMTCIYQIINVKRNHTKIL